MVLFFLHVLTMLTHSHTLKAFWRKHQPWVFTGGQDFFYTWPHPLVFISSPTHIEKALSEEWCTQGIFVWKSRLWFVLEKMDDHVWCWKCDLCDVMPWRENKAEWKKSAGRFFIAWRRIFQSGHIKNKIPCCCVYLVASSIPPPSGHQMVVTTFVRKKRRAHNGHFFTAAISKFIEIDWFLQIIVKLILPPNMKSERGLNGQGQSQHRNRRLMVGCKNVLWSVLSTKKKK